MAKNYFGHIGLSFRSASVSVLNDMVIPAAEKVDRLHRLRSAMGWDELMMVSTCNRIEFYFSADSGTGLDPELFLSVWNPSAPVQLADQLELTRDRQTVLHLMRVAASVESMVIGETQILKQIKDSHQEATNLGLAGRNLHFLIRAVIQSSKRVYSGTQIATNPVSVASMTYRKILNFPSATRRLAFIGAGDVIQSMVPYFSKQGNFSFHFINRTEKRARILAESYQGTWESLESFQAAPCDFDCLISCTSADQYVLPATLLEKITASGGSHPRLLIDLANPRDIDPAAAGFDGITLVNLEDIEGLAEENNRIRQTEIAKVDAILQEEVQEFANMLEEREIDLLFSELPDEIEQIKLKATEKILRTRLKHLSEADQDVIREFADYLSGKFIQVPLINAKKILLDQKGTA